MCGRKKAKTDAQTRKPIRRKLQEISTSTGDGQTAEAGTLETESRGTADAIFKRRSSCAGELGFFPFIHQPASQTLTVKAYSSEGSWERRQSRKKNTKHKMD